MRLCSGRQLSPGHDLERQMPALLLIVVYGVVVLADVTSRRSFPSSAVLCEGLPTFAPS